MLCAWFTRSTRLECSSHSGSCILKWSYGWHISSTRAIKSRTKRQEMSRWLGRNISCDVTVVDMLAASCVATVAKAAATRKTSPYGIFSYRIWASTIKLLSVAVEFLVFFLLAEGKPKIPTAVETRRRTELRLSDSRETRPQFFSVYFISNSKF